MNLVIFGPPGAGKGTQSKLIAKKYKLYQLSTGELLRGEISNKTALGNKISKIIAKTSPAISWAKCQWPTPIKRPVKTIIWRQLVSKKLKKCD